MGMDHSTLLNELIRSDNTPSTTYNNSNSRVFDERKEQLRTIVNSLRESSSTYQPEATIDLITEYNGSGTRILYSEVTNAVYGMTPEERGTVATNLDKLIEYVFDESQQLHDDVKDAATRLWDHFNLAFRQVDNVKHTYGEAKEEVERELYQKSKATGVFTPVAALLFDVKGLPFIRLAILLQVPFFKLLAVLLILKKTRGRIEQADWQMPLLGL